MKTFSQTFATLILVLTSATMAFAQAGAPIKARGAFGEGFWEASKRQRHAQDHAQILYYYGQAQQPVAVEKVKEHSTAVRQNVVASQKALTEAKKAYADNKDVQAAVAKIEAIHKKVGTIAICSTPRPVRRKRTMWQFTPAAPTFTTILPRPTLSWPS